MWDIKLSIKIEDIQIILEKNSLDLTEELKRLFHGRGGVYEGWKNVTIDSIDDIISVAVYKPFELENQLLEMLKEFISNTRHTTIVIQRRYLKGSPSEVVVGVLKDDLYVVENGVKIKLNLLSNQNSGYFPDMKNGRAFVESNSKGKKVLNLFSYTCAFSLFAKRGDALQVSNIDMSKSALTTGRINHHLNKQDTYNIRFSPYNILKSFSRIKRDGPYDLIIIDPPTLQKGSFEATKDYDKIIKKLSSIASPNCIVLACLNSPDLNSDFLIDLFKELAPKFEFIKRLENLKEFEVTDEEKSLKNLVFKLI